MRTAVLLFGCCLLIVSIGIGLFGLVMVGEFPWEHTAHEGVDLLAAAVVVAGVGYAAIAVAALIDHAEGDSVVGRARRKFYVGEPHREFRSGLPGSETLRAP